MVCTKCGEIIEFKDDALEDLQTKLAAEYVFFMLQHKMEIYGLCGQCMALSSPIKTGTVVNRRKSLHDKVLF